MYPKQLPAKSLSSSSSSASSASPRRPGSRSRRRKSSELRIQPAAQSAEKLWPAEVDLILSALDAGKSMDANRRLGTRLPYRVRATLRLFSDRPGSEPFVLYTRDVDPRGMGFITANRLPLGYGGEVELFTPRGAKVRIHCTLLRCRQAAAGWYEGAATFNREQWSFEVE
jgi:hypothetical protein